MAGELAIVTGAPGWLGSRLVESLLEGLAEVPKLAQPQFKRVRILKLKDMPLDACLKKIADRVDLLEIVEGDLRDEKSLDQLFKDGNGATVFHAAGIIHPSRGVKELFEINEAGTRSMGEKASRAGAKRFVHVSSNSPIGLNRSRSELFNGNSSYNPYMNYGKSKMLAEMALKEIASKSDMELVIVRPPWFYGPGQPPRQSLFFSMIRSGKMPIVGDGNNLRSMAYIDNICQGLLLCASTASANGKAYWIADRKPYSMNEIVDTVERVLEKDFQLSCAHKRMRMPGIASEVALLADATLQSVGLYHQKIHVLSEMNKDIACTISQAEAELGFDPKVALEEGMRRSIRWVLDQGQSI